jgi:outer membrane biosynthesis protein TonB
MSSVVELRTLAKTLGIRGYSVAKKADLITLIEAHQAKKDPVAPVAPAVVEQPKVKELKVKEPKVKEPKEPKVKEPKEPKEPKEETSDTPKRGNEWNNFLAEYRRENNVSLKQAMSSAREAYSLKRNARVVAEKEPIKV